jgi:hypothetical protein
MSLVGLFESLDWSPRSRFQTSGNIVGRRVSMIDAVQEVSRACLEDMGTNQEQAEAEIKSN